MGQKRFLLGGLVFFETVCHNCLLMVVMITGSSKELNVSVRKKQIRESPF